MLRRSTYQTRPRNHRHAISRKRQGVKDEHACINHRLASTVSGSISGAIRRSWDRKTRLRAIRCAVAQAPERLPRSGDLLRGVLYMHIEDDAGPGLPGPGEKAFVVSLDQTDRAIDHVGLMLEKVGADGLHEVGKRRAGHERLGDHL